MKLSLEEVTVKVRLSFWQMSLLSVGHECVVSGRFVL